MFRMEKGYDGLFNFCYDFDVDLNDTTLNSNFDINSHDFSIIVSKFLCEKNKIEKNLQTKNDEEIRKMAYLKDCCNFYKREKIAETMKDNSKGGYFISFKTKMKIDEISTQLAFEKIKHPLMLLARNGFDKALAFYLAYEKPESWDDALFHHAKEISRKQLKTPEEWEVEASLHFHDKIIPNIKNMHELGLLTEKTWSSNTVFLAEGMQRQYEESMKEFLTYLEAYNNSAYAHAMQKAMLGYYAKYFKRQSFPYCSYLDDFLRLNHECRGLLIDKDAFATFSNGCFFSSDKLSKILDSVNISEPFKLFKGEKKIDVKEAFAQVVSMIEQYYQEEDALILDRMAVARNKIFYKKDLSEKKMEAQKKQGFRILAQVANRGYINSFLKDSKEECSLDFALQKTLNKEW